MNDGNCVNLFCVSPLPKGVWGTDLRGQVAMGTDHGGW